MSVPLALSESVPALTLTVPVLLKLPENRFSVCWPGAVLLKVPALPNTGRTPLSMTTGVAALLPRLNTPPASLTKVGAWPVAPVWLKYSRSSPPSVAVPALSQRRLS